MYGHSVATYFSEPIHLSLADSSYGGLVVGLILGITVLIVICFTVIISITACSVVGARRRYGQYTAVATTVPTSPAVTTARQWAEMEQYPTLQQAPPPAYSAEGVYPLHRGFSPQQEGHPPQQPSPSPQQEEYPSQQGEYPPQLGGQQGAFAPLNLSQCKLATLNNPLRSHSEVTTNFFVYTFRCLYVRWV